MNTLTTLFPIAGLLIIVMWFFYETKVYFAIINWFSNAKVYFFTTWTWDRFYDLFSNVS